MIVEIVGLSMCRWVGLSIVLTIALSTSWSTDSIIISTCISTIIGSTVTETISAHIDTSPPIDTWCDGSHSTISVDQYR
mgnify:CR=1 FL=1